ncbi:BAHD acyltransferase DCR [Camellia lanceoleosa]|uniref:BAHD acyltransferase DCR n=1 Tax=Camellia lanceoleosa TaxID=1840588 RepID=A0ACC0G5T6_9ERIC|nr:BAHD acyltransferase DCR [Camellia lanceoleosa]
MPSSSSVSTISECIVFPQHKSAIKSLRLSVFDLPMLSCEYMQMGVLLSQPPLPISSLISRLQRSLSTTLSYFPALAGRLSTHPSGHLHILCNDSGIEFVHAEAKHLFIDDILIPVDVPNCFKEFFAFDNTLSYAARHKPLAAVQVTELGDGIFVGCTVNHAVTDGTSFWNFFNTFAEICRGAMDISKLPDFRRNTVFDSRAVLRFPEGGPSANFSGDKPLSERIFHFSRESILRIKLKANKRLMDPTEIHTEIVGKQCNDNWTVTNGVINGNRTSEISSFQSLCAQLWRAVTRARKLDGDKTTTFRMAVNCRHRLEPRLHPLYFGNAIQSIRTVAVVGDLLSRDLIWSGDLLQQNVVEHDDAKVRSGVKVWERNPTLLPLGNSDGASITMGSSPRFPMYDNDFGWGPPMAVRSGRANKFDGKISAFPGREGGGSVDLEVVLLPETMAGLETDMEFMQYVS